MDKTVRRILVEKKEGFRLAEAALCADLKENLQLTDLKSVRLINRYDVEGLDENEYTLAKRLVFSEAPVDDCYDEQMNLPENAAVFAVEFLPGQFDQRADSAEECISIITQKERPKVRYAKLYVLEGTLTDAEIEVVKEYVVNPVEARLASLDKPATLEDNVPTPADVKVVENFINMDRAGLQVFADSMGFAMDMDDLAFCQEYFKNTEKRNPTITEMRMIDTYWSDHCRHTTFATRLANVRFADHPYCDVMNKTYHTYLDTKVYVGNENRDTCFMSIATMGVKKLRKDGILDKLDESEEINACSIHAMVDIDGVEEPWLILFKNETHNHPTEIEPFGGAATCLGGAIRDPLSGRAYVYQAMRVTGSGDPRVSMKDTLRGKLMQRKISTTAAAGYSSYGNQIGLATGQVNEIYHEGYVAKRMEIGAVVGAVKESSVVREVPDPDDIVILLGGKTGRDGCGGATGSSKAHTEDSITECGAEVQKGNPPVERKLQRLFRKAEVTRMIKRCNDFGAGGVSVAIGELADGLKIDLDKVPKKYEGLDGTELAISESQERMAVVIEEKDYDAFMNAAEEENLEATKVAVVTKEDRLVMSWRGKVICDISRDFLNTNGVTKVTDIEVEAPRGENFFAKKDVNDVKAKWLDTLSDLNSCSQKGLAERFDSTIGAGTVVMPFGGKYQMTPSEAMVAKVPVLSGTTDTATAMAYGFDPYLSSYSTYHGAVYAVIESVAKLVATGANISDIYLTFQEYFERLGNDPKRWGKPFGALLGAFDAQLGMEMGAIGGKDSMSGSFNDLDVPPTLVSFAIAPVKASKVISNDLKKAGSKLYVATISRDENDLPNYAEVKAQYKKITDLILAGKVLSASAVRSGGICETLSKMAFGNRIGFSINSDIEASTLFSADYGCIVLEVADLADVKGIKGYALGETTSDETISVCGEAISLCEAQSVYEKPLEKIYPTKVNSLYPDKPQTISYNEKNIYVCKNKVAKPRVFIPVFPGTNCEYDTARKFEAAGATADVFVMKNLTPQNTADSLRTMAEKIVNSQMIMLPGGFSGGDEPDGSGKFIMAAFRNPLVCDATMNLLKNRDGLMLGICNGFQALIKLGLVPYGEITDIKDTDPTLTFNTIGRHVSCMVTTRVASNKSPWFSNVNVGETYSIAVSHGEGRFCANADWLKKLQENGQIATQYVDFEGSASYETAYNPNDSVMAIEGITSPDGRVLGKMGHSERCGENIFKNIVGEKDQKLFEAGVSYFK